MTVAFTRNVGKVLRSKRIDINVSLKINPIGQIFIGDFDLKS